MAEISLSPCQYCTLHESTSRYYSMSTWSLFADGSTLTPIRSAESNSVRHRGQGKWWVKTDDIRIIKLLIGYEILDRENVQKM
jgi:hypothetical protein